MKLNSSTFPGKVNKSQALALLTVLQNDIHSSTERRDRAVVWGKDIQGLTYLEMARAMDYSIKWIHDIYHRTRGGEK